MDVEANVQLPANICFYSACAMRNIPAFLTFTALLFISARRKVSCMMLCITGSKAGKFLCRISIQFAIILAFFGLGRISAVAEPAPSATASFNSYIGVVESRLAQQHRNTGGSPAIAGGSAQNDARLRNGELIIEKLAPASPEGFPGAMLHHWRGTAFAPGANAADFERLMRNYGAYPQYYAPQVLRSKILSQLVDHYQVLMRVRQKHVLTVVLDTAYDVNFARIDAKRGFSISRSSKIAEIEAAGTPKERALAPGDDHGFLWRLNTYWSYEERDGGLYMQIESVSLTRAIPTGLGWAIGPFVESVPRESLEFTLRSTCNALKK
jgi:hypothetical protein